MDSIRIAALGRPVNLGAFYDYDTGQYLKPGAFTWQRMSKARRWSDTLNLATQTSFLIPRQTSDVALFLELNAASERCKPQVDWCRPLLQDQCPKDKVQVLVRLQRLIRTDCIEVGDIVDSKQLQEGGSETGYLVRQITYGAQAVVVLQMDAVDEAERQEVQDELLLAAVSFFSRLGDLSKRSQVLDRATCRFYSDLMGRSEWISFAHCLNHCVYPFVMVQEVNWLPQNVLLCPTGKSRSAQQDKDFISDLKVCISTLKQSIKNAGDQSKKELNSQFAKDIPHLKEHIVAFESSLMSLSSYVNFIHEKIRTSRQVEDYYNLFNVIVTACRHYIQCASFDLWLATKRREIRTLKNLLADVKLPIVSPEHLPQCDNLRVFFLSTFNGPDLLIEEIRRRTKPTEEMSHFRVYQIGKQSDEHFIDAKSRLLRFALRAKRSGKPSVLSTSDHHEDQVLLVQPRMHSANSVQSMTAAESSFPTGQVVPSAALADSKRIVFTAHRRDSQGSVVASAQGDWPSQQGGQLSDIQSQTWLNPSDLSPLSAKRRRTSSASIDKGQFDGDPVGSSESNKRQPQHSVSRTIQAHDTSNSTTKKYRVESGKSTLLPKSSSGADKVSLAVGRAAEVLLRSSKLLIDGQPSVYFLQTNQKQSASLPLRWFEIGRRNQAMPHKTIILVGATGAGKSTLVDAMFNYVLGVQWHDPFRFRIVGGEGHRSQAHSQTRYITSYTLHYTEGQAVPYSLTVIDTPGYGDTEGLERDEEITRSICSFLTEAESNVREINAICFVASSADARLTSTQKYIISSVLSLFGKDVVGHIRLLATFSDGGKPPLVEACRQAGFPLTTDAGTGQVAGYSKFNNSVLFAANGQDEDTQLDRTFWLMAEQGFQSFFSMLALLPSKSLSQTKRVAEKRIERDKSLQTIERTLDDCWGKLGPIRHTEQSLEDIAHRIGSKMKSRTLEREPVAVKEKCRRHWFAYNCTKCRVTCIPQMERSQCFEVSSTCSACKCPPESHEYQSVFWEEKEQLVKYKDSKQLCIDEATRDSYETALSKHKQELQLLKSNIVDMLKQTLETERELDDVAWIGGAQSPEDLVSQIRTRLERDRPLGFQDKIGILNDCLQVWRRRKDATLLSSPTGTPSKSDHHPTSKAKSLKKSWSFGKGQSHKRRTESEL